MFAKELDENSDIKVYKKHIQINQKWLKDGLDIQKNSDKCPYCFQSVKNNEIVQAYKQFFSEQCQALINQVMDLKKEIFDNFSHDKALLIERTVSENSENSIFWRTMDNTISGKISFIENYSAQIKEYRETLIQLIERKLKNILASLQFTEAEEKILKIAGNFISAINIYNSTIDADNAKIMSIKSKHQDLNSLKQEYATKATALKCQQVTFHNEETKLSFLRYQQLIQEKKKVTKRLTTLRKEISNASKKLLEDYQVSINNLLKNFGVEFRIQKIERKADTARKEILTFAIELKGTSFDPNGSREMPYSLANTLSSGDRSTLAFALFLAKIQHVDLSNTILVFDDPITSLDFFRKQQTSKQISIISSRAKQIIVLTHSMEFIKLFSHLPAEGKYFKLFKADSSVGVVLTPYNKLSDMCVSKHNDEYQTLRTYLSEPESVKRFNVLKSIRPFVETTLCTYFPELATINPRSLGSFINNLKKKQIDPKYLNNLELINNSIVIENHGGNPIADDHSNLTDEELRNLCKIAINLVAPLNMTAEVA